MVPPESFPMLPVSFICAHPFVVLLQNKDLKSRVSHLEGSQRSNQDVVVSRLEGRVQELEGRLEGEER